MRGKAAKTLRKYVLRVFVNKVVRKEINPPENMYQLARALKAMERGAKRAWMSTSNQKSLSGLGYDLGSQRSLRATTLDLLRPPQPSETPMPGT